MAKPLRPTDAELQRAVDCYWEAVPPTWNRIRGNVRAIAAGDFGVTLEQFHILRHVQKGRGSISELAAAKQISRPAISQAVDVLVTKGLITRRQATDDRRFVRLELTRSGADLLNAIFGRNREWMIKQMRALSRAEIARLVQALETLKTTFGEPAG